MTSYDSCYYDSECRCVRCRYKQGAKQAAARRTLEAQAEHLRRMLIASRERRGRRDPLGRPIVTTASPLRDALIDIAHDCGTLEAAQRRAKEALREARP